MYILSNIDIYFQIANCSININIGADAKCLYILKYPGATLPTSISIDYTLTLAYTPFVILFSVINLINV